jgi:hypothetical protein
MSRTGKKVRLCTEKQVKTIKEMVKGKNILLENLVWSHTVRTQLVYQMTSKEASGLIEKLKELQA